MSLARNDIPENDYFERGSRNTSSRMYDLWKVECNIPLTSYRRVKEHTLSFHLSGSFRGSKE